MIYPVLYHFEGGYWRATCDELPSWPGSWGDTLEEAKARAELDLPHWVAQQIEVDHLVGVL